MMMTRSAAVFGFAAALVLQTASCFSTPMSMALRPAAGAQPGGAVGRRDATSALLLAVGGQVAALSLLQPHQTYEKPSKWMVDAFLTTRPSSAVVAPGEDFSEQELFKYQRRMRKVADNMGAGEMEKIAEAMGFNVRCMSSDVCRKSAFSSEVNYD
jgi:hypothetical protein